MSCTHMESLPITSLGYGAKVHWFDVDDECYGVVEERGKSPVVIDQESTPINTDSRHWAFLHHLPEQVTDEMRGKA